MERLWSSRALIVIQAKREQRHPGLPRGAAGRVLKVIDRQWSRAVHADRIYLERNCRLEPVQSPDPERTAAEGVRETARAWARGEPAIVETHRVNFAHTDAAVVAVGRRALGAYLDGVAALPGPGPLFMADMEIAALARTGTSARRGGGVVVVRNASRARRLAVLPGGGPQEQGSRILVLLDAGFHGLWHPGGRSEGEMAESVAGTSDIEMDLISGGSLHHLRR